MKKFIIIIFIPFAGILFAQPKISKINSMPGAFSRMGFGARGIGMGNAMSAVTEGNLVAYYNPALSVFQEKNSIQSSYTFLSLDRSLNYLNFTRRFDFYSKNDTSKNRKPRSSAGLSAGIINSGVSKIDGRDNQGNKTGDLSTSENQFFLAFANRFSEKLAIGIELKLYYYKLYEDIKSTGVGIDLGAVYRINKNFNLAVSISDINSKYKWDTSPVYDQEGTTTKDNFPVLKKIGLRYKDNASRLIIAADFESSNAESNIIRAGVEYNIIEKLYLRAGLDQFNFSNSDSPVRPSLGFSYFKEFGKTTFGIDYAFVVEPYSPQDRHVVGLSVNL